MGEGAVRGGGEEGDVDEVLHPSGRRGFGERPVLPYAGLATGRGHHEHGRDALEPVAYRVRFRERGAYRVRAGEARGTGEVANQEPLRYALGGQALRPPAAQAAGRAGNSYRSRRFAHASISCRRIR